MDHGWRLATENEILDLLTQPGAPHVTFGCIHCGMVNWHAKNIALSAGGHYTGTRNLFVSNWSRGECNCPSNGLRAVLRAEEIAS